MTGKESQQKTRFRWVGVTVGGLIVSVVGASLALIAQTYLTRALEQPAQLQIVEFNPTSLESGQLARGTIVVENIGAVTAANCTVPWSFGGAKFFVTASKGSFFVKAGETAFVPLDKVGNPRFPAKFEGGDMLTSAAVYCENNVFTLRPETFGVDYR